jgi:preprotein translocase subunit SecG
MNIWNYVMIGSVVLMTILILIQVRGASLGAGMGGGGEVNTVRRGADKSIFNLTIICAITFALSIILEIILG